MIAFIDLETGGFSRHNNGLCEIAVIIVNNDLDIIDTFNCLIQPYRKEDNTFVSYKDDAMRIHGIPYEKLLSDGIEIGVALDLVSVMFDKHKVTSIAGHNIKSFDIHWLETLSNRFCSITYSSYDLIDTMHLAKNKFNATSYSLESLCIMLNIVNTKSHSALSDATACLELYKKLRDE